MQASELQRNGKILVLKLQIILKLVLSSDFFMEAVGGKWAADPYRCFKGLVF